MKNKNIHYIIYYNALQYYKHIEKCFIWTKKR